MENKTEIWPNIAYLLGILLIYGSIANECDEINKTEICTIKLQVGTLGPKMEDTFECITI